MNTPTGKKTGKCYDHYFRRKMILSSTYFEWK
jgi:hypothetical protein